MFHAKGATGGEESIDGRHGASGLGWAEAPQRPASGTGPMSPSEGGSTGGRLTGASSPTAVPSAGQLVPLNLE